MTSQISKKSPLIIAMDFASLSPLEELLEQLDPQRYRLKIGKAMFTRFGPALVADLQKRGFEIFLDLKFHDIPQQVAEACRAAADLNVWMLTVHASGGQHMLAAAQNAIAQSSTPPLLVAVTVLTSLAASDLVNLGINNSPQQQVLHLAKLALQAGVAGLVCSPQEVTLLRQQINSSYCLVTPGVRPATWDADDQQRTLTPQQALLAGADYLVIGRPITQAKNPLRTLKNIETELTTTNLS